MNQNLNLPQPFIAAAVIPREGFQQLPITDDKGVYGAFTNVEVKPVKDKDKSFYVELKFETMNGESGLYRLNLFHEDDKVVNQAYGTLSAILHCMRKENEPLVNLGQLLNVPLNAVVKRQKNPTPKELEAGKTESDYTEIVAWRAVDGTKPWEQPQQAAAPAGFQPQQAASGGFGGQQVAAPAVPSWRGGNK